MDGGGALDVEAELRSAATSGLMDLTGHPDGPPLSPPPGVVTRLDRLAESVRRLAATLGSSLELRWENVCTSRAAILGLHRSGRVSANGTCRLLRAQDDVWVAVNLSRPDDLASVQAIVEGRGSGDPWEVLASAASTMPAASLAQRAQLLGVPAAQLPMPGVDGTRSEAGCGVTDAGCGVTDAGCGVTDAGCGVTEAGCRVTEAGCRVTDMWTPSSSTIREMNVVDLSAMWAGPLAASILTRAGATVTKVESVSRPDPTKKVPAFYRMLQPPGQRTVTLDFAIESGRRELRRLLDRADLVIEASRPRALEQLGCGPFDVASRPGRVWVSITGHGRAGPGKDWVAFGDDAAVAGGLVAWETEDLPVFLGDALGDPLTALVAAEGALAAIAQGGGKLLDVSMARCAASVVGSAPRQPALRAKHASEGGWFLEVGGHPVPVLPPQVRQW
jgi:hypothetical protein